MTKYEVKGWRGIGRALVVATTGPDEVLEKLQMEDVVAIQLAGSCAQLSRRQTLAPELLDVVVLDATRDDRDDVVDLAETLRARSLACVLIVGRDDWGQRTFERHLSVYSHAGAVRATQLWTAISVAAQLTWSLAWLRLERPPRRPIPDSEKTGIIDMQAALRSRVAAQEVRPSRTTPWSPPPSMLLELTEAFNDET